MAYADTVAPEATQTPDEFELIGYAAIYDDPDKLIHAAETVRDDGWKQWDCHTPYPMHGLDAAMGLGASWVPYVTLGMGFLGAVTALAMQTWMNAVDYPLIIGGKPLFSLPTHAPITFELFILFAGISTFLTVLVACKLFRFQSPLHDTGLMELVTGDKFAVVLDAKDAKWDAEQSKAMLDKTEPLFVTPIYEHDYYREDIPGAVPRHLDAPPPGVVEESVESEYKHPDLKPKRGPKFGGE